MRYLVRCCTNLVLVTRRQRKEAWHRWIALPVIVNRSKGEVSRQRLWGCANNHRRYLAMYAVTSLVMWDVGALTKPGAPLTTVTGPRLGHALRSVAGLGQRAYQPVSDSLYFRFDHVSKA